MGDEDNDAIAARLAAMERDVLQREAAAEEKRLSLLREVAKHDNDARTARSQYEDARRKSLGENTGRGTQVRLLSFVNTYLPTHARRPPASSAPGLSRLRCSRERRGPGAACRTRSRARRRSRR